MKPEFRLFLLRECVVNPPPEPQAGAKATLEAVAGAGSLLALFAPKLIELAIGGVATLIKKAGADDTDQVSGRVFTDLYVADRNQALQPNPEIGCLLGVYGEFPATEPNDDSRESAVDRLVRAGLIPKGSSVHVLFEAAIRPTHDGTAFFLDTRHFCVREFIGDGNRSERAFVATLHVTEPSATADGGSIAVGNIDLGRLTRGTELIRPGCLLDAHPRYQSNLMPWGRISEISKAAHVVDVTAGTAADRFYMPVTFHLTLSETADGNRFLAALGALLEGSKKEAADEIARAVLPEDRAKAEAERAASAERLYQDELDAEIAVREARKELNAASTPDDRSILAAKLVSAQRKRERGTALRAAAGLPAREPIP